MKAGWSPGPYFAYFVIDESFCHLVAAGPVHTAKPQLEDVACGSGTGACIAQLKRVLHTTDDLPAGSGDHEVLCLTIWQAVRDAAAPSGILIASAALGQTVVAHEGTEYYNDLASNNSRQYTSELAR